jgi:hypothetical protein
MIKVLLTSIQLSFFAFIFLSDQGTLKRPSQLENRENLASQQVLNILYPKNLQKVRGSYSISGKSLPDTFIEISARSKYFKTKLENNRISKGAGPVNRMYRTFKTKSDARGNWKLKELELKNAGWEETFIITALSGNHKHSIQVFDNTPPVSID